MRIQMDIQDVFDSAKGGFHIMEKSLLELAGNFVEGSSEPAVMNAYRLALDSIHSIVFIISMEKKILYMNEWARKLTGFSVDDYKSHPCDCMKMTNRWEDTCALNRLANGEKYTYFSWNNVDYECEAAYIKDESDQLLAVLEVISPTGKDIRRIDLEQELFQEIRFDKLTGLFNRDYFCERTRQLLDYHPQEEYALVYWNVRHFKIINDVFSSRTGDRILIDIGQKVKRLVGHEGTASRLTDDHFVFCLPKRKISGEWLRNNAALP